MLESLFGSLLGGFFRLAPEVLKWLDRKNSRSHELEMFRLQTDLEKQRNSFALDKTYADHGMAQLEAIQDAFREQAETAKSSYKWVAALSALVRPGITYTVFGLYVAVKLTAIQIAIIADTHWQDVLVASWTVEDYAILNMILTFWFVGRAIEKYTGGGR